MAIAVRGGHTSRALDFYKQKDSMYFIVGGTIPWENEVEPPEPNSSDYKLVDIVGLKKIDHISLVKLTEEDGEEIISYRDKKWKKVIASVETTLSSEVTINSTVIPVSSIEGINVGDKLRVDNIYEGIITNISGNFVTLDTESPTVIPAGKKVVGGALAEGAHHVYLDCYLDSDTFPIATYRQIGLCTGVSPNNLNIMKASGYGTEQDEFEYLGTLEILDNRPPNTRDVSQREFLSLIIEF